VVEPDLPHRLRLRATRTVFLRPSAEQTRLRLTDDFQEGVKAMAERRVPNFACR
jgi:hypothetical protein